MKSIIYFVFVLVLSLFSVHHTSLLADDHSESNSTSESETTETSFLQKVTGFFKGLFSDDSSAEDEQSEQPSDTESTEEDFQDSNEQEEQPSNQEEQPHEPEKDEAMNSGQQFLEENKSKSDIKVSDSGLQYKILKEGQKKPTATDTVQVHYRGTLIDGTEFDSSYKRGEPTSFPLQGVIAGWTEGLQYVGVGGKIKLFIPPKLGYGSQAVGEKIPANSVLIFDIELLKIL